MAFAKQKRLSQNLPSPSEDSVLGSFADRFVASGGRSRDAGSGGPRRGASPTPSAPAPTATTTAATTAASQNFLKNIDPKLAAALAAGTLGTAGLAAFVANRRRKRRRDSDA